MPSPGRCGLLLALLCVAASHAACVNGVSLICNHDTDFANSGDSASCSVTESSTGWDTSATGGYGSTPFRYYYGSGARTATYTFSSLGAGSTFVVAAFTPNFGTPTTTAYSLTSAATTITGTFTNTANQFTQFGPAVTTGPAGTVTVKLVTANGGGKFLFADAVKISCNSNECTGGSHNCDPMATCTDSAASFTCACNTGFAGSGISCADLNACRSYPCSASMICTDKPAPALNNVAGRTCSCNAGYSGATCATDINECTANTHNCASGGAVCVNTIGSFTCTCMSAEYSGAACSIFTGDVEIYSAANVVTFRSALAGVTVINGYVEIISAPITEADLTVMFGSVTSVGGYVYIGSNAALATLEGLRNVTSIGEDMQIINNAALTTLEGLRSLTSVGYFVHISGNSALTTLEGLRNLKSIRGASLTTGSSIIYISNNGALTTGLPLSGLTCKGSGAVLCANTPACSKGVVPAVGVSTPCT